MARMNLSAVRLVLMLLLAMACQGVRADTAIRLFQTHVGNVNFVGTQKTIRDQSNDAPCRVYAPSVYRYATLSGIPASATIISAQLYWAGSGYYPDFNVVMDGLAITAPSGRRYYSTTIGNNYNYFSGAADVTAQVKLKRNATYAFRGLTVDYNAPYCAVEGVLGGFSLLVIYSDPSQPFRLLNLYEGFQYMRYTGFTLNLSGFRVPDPIGTATGRVGHITWEGDPTLSGGGEDLLFNNYELADSRNSSGNQFNSKSSINGDDFSYGIDFDAYTVGNPIIKSGQTTASTRYQSGQDLVLLSAEIVALPNVPLSDFAIAVDVEDKMILGRNTDITIMVENNGPSTANGPTVVTSTLPAGLSFVSGSGDDWSCSAVSKNLTCTHPGTLELGKQLPVLTVTARVTAIGVIKVSASVSGKMYDPQPANNAASDQGTSVQGESRYVFTDTACVGLKKLGEDGQCSPVLAAGAAGVERRIFITAVDKDDVPVKVNSATENVSFALKCINPRKSAGVMATVDGLTLNVCADYDKAPAFSASSTVTFTDYSGEVKFVYADVGKVELSLRVSGSESVSTSSQFVSLPYELRITQVVRVDGAAVPTGLNDEDPFVMRAGEPFKITVQSLAYINDTTRAVTKNFGNEDKGTRPVFSVPTVTVGASSTKGIAAMTHDAGIPLPDLEVISFPEPEAGTATGEFAWQEVGIISLKPGIKGDTYLNASTGSVQPIPAIAGRFIPHHFETTVAGKLVCLERMGCATDAEIAAYSLQEFDVTITARSANGEVTRNYESTFARDVTLSSVDKVGGTAKAGLNDTNAPADEFTDGIGKASPHVALPNGFNRTLPLKQWGKPETFFIRAKDENTTSLRLVPEDSLEGGLRIVNGRLFVPNAYGSERISLPLKLSAQYWTGSNWESSKDQLSDVDSAKAVFSNAGTLNLKLLPAGAVVLKDGVTTAFGVKATPAQAGTADLVIDHRQWLPSTKGRLKFGTYKSPLIYLRELH